MDSYKRELHDRVGSLEELAPSSRLRSFRLPSIITPRMPSWINPLSVPLLFDLELHVEMAEAQDLQILGRLPSLIHLVFFSAEKCVSYTFGSDEFQKLNSLATNVEITLGDGALPMLEVLTYSASAGRKDSLVPWNKSCPLPYFVLCVLDCANNGRREVKAAKAILRKAERTHPENLLLGINLLNYSRKAARLIDALELILAGLDRPDGKEITADQRELRRMITSLENLLRDKDEPRVGRYGEQELRGIVTKFKSVLHDDAGTDQEEEPDNSAAMDSDDDAMNTDTDYDYDSDCNDDRDNDDYDHGTEQEEVDNDVATSGGTHDEGAASKP